MRVLLVALADVELPKTNHPIISWHLAKNRDSPPRQTIEDSQGTRSRGLPPSTACERDTRGGSQRESEKVPQTYPPSTCTLPNPSEHSGPF